jgi:hypothetical protein
MTEMIDIYRAVIRRSTSGEQVSSPAINRAKSSLARYCIDGICKLRPSNMPVLLCSDGSAAECYSYRDALNLFERLLQHPSGSTYLATNSERIQNALKKQDLEPAPVF